MLKIGKRPGTVRVELQVASDDGPAAAVVLAPIEPGMRRRALRAARRMLEVAGVEDPSTVDGDTLGDLAETVSREMLRMGIEAVEGIVDEATGEPFALTPDRATRMRTVNDADRPIGTIDDLLANDFVFDKLDADYVIADAARRAEKNGSSGSLNGTSAAATPAPDTANSPAKRTPRAAAAKRARTGKTRSRPTPAKASGRP